MDSEKLKNKRQNELRPLTVFSFRALHNVLLSGLLVIMFSACREVITYKSNSKIISTEIDNSLADSVLVFGKVVSAIDTLSPMRHSRVWTNELTKDTYSDNNGLYRLKIPSGTYTINCKEDNGTDEFKVTIKDISFSPNEKVEIHFYLGEKVE